MKRTIEHAKEKVEKAKKLQLKAIVSGKAAKIADETVHKDEDKLKEASKKAVKAKKEADKAHHKVASAATHKVAPAAAPVAHTF